MTRFARSKGSKASNERIPEEATPWKVMKHQLHEKKQEILENKKRKEFEQTRMENYKAFLEKKEDDIESEWVEFEEQTTKEKVVKKSKKQKKSVMAKDTSNLQDELKLQNLIDKIEEVLDKDEEATCNVNKTNKKKVKPTVAVVNTTNEHTKYFKNKKKSKETVSSLNHITDKSDNENATGETNKLSKKKKAKLPKESSLNKVLVNKTGEKDVNDGITLKKKNKTKKNKYANSVHEVDTECGNANTKKNISEQQENKVGIQKSKNSKMKNNTHINSKNTEEMTEDDIKKINKKKEKKLRQLENKKKKKAERQETSPEQQVSQNIRKHKLPKEKDNQEYKRRKPNSQIETININGVNIDIDYYDGFPVKKDDAQRLRKLKKEMISKGIPKSEVQISLKLERRKAEKALAREKKKVCFNCRKSGHVLSECPDLNKSSQQEVTGTGICFKCGSTEHTHFECKVVRNDNFKYATCFICREQGHISRQCPDNQRGLYPKGGACRECGDVTHLKKDCPKFQEKQESQTIKLDTMEFNNVEELPDTNKNISKPENKSKKIVKF